MTQMKFATNPLAENKLSMSDMLRRLYEPTAEERREFQRRQAESAAKIRAAVAKWK